MSDQAMNVGILNSYCPATGASISQLVIRADGTLQLFGDRSLAQANLDRLLKAAIVPEVSERAPLPVVPRGGPLPIAAPLKTRTCKPCGFRANSPGARICASCATPFPRRGRPPKALPC
jgi:hypothetical protein